tara:strand:- start:3511 stop:3804 length:294 start_codon:yes stop_codon:yes gene_type:complete
MNKHEQAIREQLEYTPPDEIEDTFSELADSLTDVYNSHRWEWLRDNNDAVEYVDNAMRDWQPETFWELLGYAQYDWHYARLTEEWERIRDTLGTEEE